MNGVAYGMVFPNETITMLRALRWVSIDFFFYDDNGQLLERNEFPGCRTKRGRKIDKAVLCCLYASAAPFSIQLSLSLALFFIPNFE